MWFLFVGRNSELVKLYFIKILIGVVKVFMYRGFWGVK